MNYFTTIFIFLCNTTTPILPFIVQSIALVHPQQNKQVILLSDFHVRYMNLDMFGDPELVLNCIELHEEQKKSVTELAHSISRCDATKASAMVIITETPDNTIGRIFEEEAGFVEPQNDPEILAILPRIFLRNLMSAGSCPEERSAIFQRRMQRFNEIPSASFTLENGTRVILGDRHRERTDNFLSFELYANWKTIKKESLPPEFQTLSIEYVKNYLTFLNDRCLCYNIPSPETAIAVDTINTVVKNSGIAESDHICELYAYLGTNNYHDTMATLNKNILCCISYKFDFELQDYFKEFEHDPSLHYALIHVGGSHADLLAQLLTTKGYKIAEMRGITSDDIHAIDTITMNDVLSEKEQLKNIIEKTVCTLKAQDALEHLVTLFN